MHPRQASVLAEVKAVIGRLAATEPATPSGPIVLWKYEDPDGNKFFLETKKLTIKSPFSGKSFSARPTKYTPSQVGKELKDERKEQAKTATSLVDYVDRVITANPQTVLWQYEDPEGNTFWLDRKVMTALRSPYGGPQFVPKPRRIMPTQIGKFLREEGDALGGWDDPPEFKGVFAKDR